MVAEDGDVPQPMRDYKQIKSMLADAPLLRSGVRARALRCFAVLAEGEAEVHHLSSRDGGKTWSASERYFNDKGIFIRNRIIRRKDKTLFWPFYSTHSFTAST